MSRRAFFYGFQDADLVLGFASNNFGHRVIFSPDNGSIREKLLSTVARASPIDDGAFRTKAFRA
jgi:hypothetical protein